MKEKIVKKKKKKKKKRTSAQNKLPISTWSAMAGSFYNNTDTEEEETAPGYVLKLT